VELKLIFLGNFGAILNYVNYLGFSAKLYGDKNVFPWMGEYPSLTEYANVVDGYEGIINETGTIFFEFFPIFGSER
jgi:hypothetical protein